MLRIEHEKHFKSAVWDGSFRCVYTAGFCFPFPLLQKSDKYANITNGYESAFALINLK